MLSLCVKNIITQNLISYIFFFLNKLTKIVKVFLRFKYLFNCTTIGGTQLDTVKALTQLKIIKSISIHKFIINRKDKIKGMEFVQQNIFSMQKSNFFLANKEDRSTKSSKSNSVFINRLCTMDSTEASKIRFLSKIANKF